MKEKNEVDGHDIILAKARQFCHCETATVAVVFRAKTFFIASPSSIATITMLLVNLVDAYSQVMITFYVSLSLDTLRAVPIGIFRCIWCISYDTRGNWWSVDPRSCSMLLCVVLAAFSIALRFSPLLLLNASNVTLPAAGAPLFFDPADNSAYFSGGFRRRLQGSWCPCLSRKYRSASCTEKYARTSIVSPHKARIGCSQAGHW